MEVIATANMNIPDPDLWHRAAPARLPAHLGSEISAGGYVHFLEPGALATQ